MDQAARARFPSESSQRSTMTHVPRAILSLQEKHKSSSVLNDAKSAFYSNAFLKIIAEKIIQKYSTDSESLVFAVHIWREASLCLWVVTVDSKDAGIPKHTKVHEHQSWFYSSKQETAACHTYKAVS